MKKIGLTGSIGMGKSTVAGMFAARGVPVWDADTAVHRLYAPDAAGTHAIAMIAPDVISENGVDRAKLSAKIAETPSLLTEIEAQIHPLVRGDRAAFSEANASEEFCIFDIPLLFETGSAGDFDHIVVVSAPYETQRARVLAREGMTAEKFDLILSRQMPDEEKRRHADFVIETGTSLEETDAQVGEILELLRDA